MATPLSLLVLALFASVAVGTAAAILAWRQRPEPGATPLALLSAGQTWWSICIIFRLQAPTQGWTLAWLDLGWVGVVVIPVAWLLFALEYTGHDQFVRPRYIAALSVVPAVTVVLALTSQFHDLMTVRVAGLNGYGIWQLQQGGVWFWVVATYTYLLGLAGMVPLFRLLTSEAPTFRGQSLALVVGTVVPWATNVLHVVGAFPTTGIDPTPVGFSVAGAAYLWAITRFRLFETSPAPTRRAREFLFDQMQEGAVVVDRNGFVVDLNDSIIDILDIDPDVALGAPAEAVVPEYDRLPTEGSVSGHLTVGEGVASRSYDAIVTSIRNVRGQPIGRVIRLHDISSHVRQQQRLEVLNRVLRHNIRTETSVIHGHATRLSGESAEEIKRRALRIAAIGHKGREAIDLFDATHEDQRPKPLEALLTHSVSFVREEYPDVTVELCLPDTETAVPGVFETVFSNLIENAARHNTSEDPRVRVTARRTDGCLRVEIADNGPGIHDDELEALERGTETPLSHASGMGLWLAKWGTDIAGGDLQFEERDRRGTVVIVTVPDLTAPATDSHAPDTSTTADVSESGPRRPSQEHNG